MTQHVGELNPPVRLMLTPGPSSIDPRVYRAMATPLVGHMDPWFKGCMEETQILLRQIFQTENRITMPLSASGSGGIEASVLNSLEEGDEGIVAVNGVFSERMYEIALRASSKVVKVEAPYGKPVDAEDVRRAGKGKKIKIVGFAQGETSTGVITGIDAYRKVADELGALLIVDTVASLAAVPVDVDKQRIDICFSGSQKAISAPPGMSPITVSPAAEEVFRKRKTKVQSWYFDLTTAMNYWGKDRLYHHTPPISLIFALREAMRLVVEEGLEAVLSRKQRATPAVPPIFDGEREAKLIALACSKPPKGRTRWTLRLLENKVVELGIVERASDSTIGRTLKKTLSNRIGGNAGSFRRRRTARS